MVSVRGRYGPQAGSGGDEAAWAVDPHSSVLFGPARRGSDGEEAGWMTTPRTDTTAGHRCAICRQPILPSEHALVVRLFAPDGSQVTVHAPCWLRARAAEPAA